MSNSRVAVTSLDVAAVTVSFGVTAARLGLTLSASVLLATSGGAVPYAVACMGIIVLMDWLDGAVFRLSALQEDAVWRVRRRVADSIADRVVVFAFAAAVLTRSHSFLPFFVAILLREGAVSGYTVSRFFGGTLLAPGRWAKAAAASVALLGVAYLTASPIATLPALALMVSMSALAVLEYRETFRESCRRPAYSSCRWERFN